MGLYFERASAALKGAFGSRTVPERASEGECRTANAAAADAVPVVRRALRRIAHARAEGVLLLWTGVGGAARASHNFAAAPLLQRAAFGHRTPALGIDRTRPRPASHQTNVTQRT